MLKIEKFVTMSPEQWEIVIEGMRNPKNSWDRIDSYADVEIDDNDTVYESFYVGPNDQNLMNSLAKGGPVHAKYRRMMPVWLTINAPLYWWKEFDTYKVGTVANSCSTMHKIHAKEFELDDFSHDHLMSMDFHTDERDIPSVDVTPHQDGTIMYTPAGLLGVTINMLNKCRELYLKTKNKVYWWQMIQMLGTNYNQKRTVMLNYEVLYNIYESRKNHKLDEWHVFCDWIRELPYSELITMEFDTSEDSE